MSDFPRITADGDIIGPSMHEAVECVASDGPQPTPDLARIVAPNGSTTYGREIILDCVEKGLLEIEEYQVRLTAKGERYLSTSV